MTVITPTARMYTPISHSPRRDDRPGWIPPDVGDDWDPNPYAYQTEEELMPAGIRQDFFIDHLRSLMALLVKRNGYFFASDVFILYRDAGGKRQRFASDGLIAPQHGDMDNWHQLINSYNLEEEPLPACVFEVTSEDSHKKDLEDMRVLAEWLRIPEYVVFDIVDHKGKARTQGQLYLWRLNAFDRYDLITPDATDGTVLLKALNMRMKLMGIKPMVQDMETGEWLELPIQKLEREVEARKAAEAKVQQEAEARKALEERVRELEEKYRRFEEQGG